MGAKDCIRWFLDKYDDMDIINKIALRQLFFYGKYLIQLYKHEGILEFYNEFLNSKNIKIDENIKINKN